MNKSNDDLDVHFFIAGDDERTGGTGFFQLDVTSLLASLTIPELFEDTNKPVPGQRG